MKAVSQSSAREAFDYNTVRSTVTGLGMIPQSLLKRTFVGDAHRASDYEVTISDYDLNEHAKHAILEWIREKKKENAPFSHGYSYFSNELINLPTLVWDSGIAGILTYVSVAYDAWRQREGI